MIGIVTDSNAQLPPELCERFGVEVVPLTVTIDDVDYLEGVELDADDFYARFEQGAQPKVSTSQPSPVRFMEAFDRLAKRGCTEILSIHIGSSISGTLNSARIAARDASVRVRLVDTGTASFGVACCVWEAAEALARGASIDDAARVAEQAAGRVGNVFVVKALDLARSGGRLRISPDADTEAIPVLSLIDGEMRVVGEAWDLGEAAAVMADYVLGHGRDLKVAVGVADVEIAPLYDTLEDIFSEAPEVREVIRYRVSPSAGAHTGPGTAGVFFVRANAST